MGCWSRRTRTRDIVVICWMMMVLVKRILFSSGSELVTIISWPEPDHGPVEKRNSRLNCKINVSLVTGRTRREYLHNYWSQLTFYCNSTNGSSSLCSSGKLRSTPIQSLQRASYYQSKQ